MIGTAVPIDDNSDEENDEEDAEDVTAIDEEEYELVTNRPKFYCEWLLSISNFDAMQSNWKIGC